MPLVRLSCSAMPSSPLLFRSLGRRPLLLRSGSPHCYPGPQAVDIVYLNRVDFVSQHSDAWCYLRFCCTLDHLLFGFVPACDFDTAPILRVSGHRSAAPVALSIRSSDLFLHSRPDSAWRCLVGILFRYSGGVDCTVKRIRCSRGGREVSCEVIVGGGGIVRCRLHRLCSASVCCDGCP